MTPLEAMASADVLDRYGEDAWPHLSEEDKRFCIERMRKCLRALASADLSAEAKRAGRPHRDGTGLTEGLFRAVLRKIVEEAAE
jgi:hypothetical protein